MEPTKKDIDRFWSKVDKSSDCWLWTGAVAKGRGIVTRQGKKYAVHRYVVSVVGKKIPEDYDVHHICENKLCVRPDHLIMVHHSDHGGFHSSEFFRGMSGRRFKKQEFQIFPVVDMGW